MKLGFDFGSKNIHYVLLDGNAVVEAKSINHNGNLKGCFGEIVDSLYSRFPAVKSASYGIAGTVGTSGSQPVLDTVVTAVEANRFLDTGCRTLLYVGCETFYLVSVDEEGNYSEHRVNSDCAAGTGSFIDQQAERIGYNTREFAEMAREYDGKIPPIATRCAVFAKSDIIHAQAQGYQSDAIAAGICCGVARSVLENVLKGAGLTGPVLFLGGVSRNRKVVSEITDELHVRVKVIPESQCMTALGAALLGTGTNLNAAVLTGQMGAVRETREKLKIRLTEYPDFNSDTNYIAGEVEVTLYIPITETAYKVYLGIDIGSTSTKLAVMTENEQILCGLYTRTKGNPVEAVSRLFGRVQELFKGKELIIHGVATTGSGRNLIKEVLGADLALNEISAHAYGATFLDPGVDTIIEIGGQDSKFTLLEAGQVVHSTMNYVCAAGTGSFIEEQAKRLEIGLDEIEGLALDSMAPYTSDRCTVYMERDLNILLAEGWSKSQIIAAVLYSVRDNYMSKVVGKTSLGKKVYFQGATGKNKALVAAFEQSLGKPIAVSKFCHITGALGCAVYARKQGLQKSAFEGIDFSCKVHNELCTLCTNNCNLTIYTSYSASGEKSRKTAWGLKCGRDYADRKAGSLSHRSQLEKEYAAHFSYTQKETSSPLVIGIPRAIYMEQYHFLFTVFFDILGIKTRIISSNERTIHLAKEVVCGDFCAPMNIVHGQIKTLLEKGVDYIFFPTIINEQNMFDKKKREQTMLEKKTDSYYCYYSEYGPTIVQNLPGLDLKGKLISPMLKFNNTPLETTARKMAETISSVTGHGENEVKNAFIRAYREFEKRFDSWQKIGEKKLAEGRDKIKVLLLGRPYALFDRTINNGIPGKIEAEGYELLYQSMFELDTQTKNNMPNYIRYMHWFYGQQILSAAELLKTNPNVYPVFLTCFRCSPDAYVMNYFKETMDAIGRPYLIIQLDEHGSDVGYQTRIEAGLEAFKNDFYRRDHRKKRPFEELNDPGNITKDDTILLQESNPVLSHLVKMAFESYGYKVFNVPADQKDINEGYKYVSGGECLPNVAILGSFINFIKKNNLDPEKCVFYVATACVACNFSQFYRLTRLASRKAGIKELRIIAANIAAPDNRFPFFLNLDANGLKLVSSILYKLYFRYSAYEINKGDAQKALDESVRIIGEHLKGNWSIFEKGRILMDGIIFMALTNFDPNLFASEEKQQQLMSKAFTYLTRFSHPSKHLLEAAVKIRTLFEAIPVKKERKPRIVIIGDLYMKWNLVLNDNICKLVEELGGEVVMPSISEYATVLLHHDVKEHNLRRALLNQIVLFEKGFEDVFKGMFDHNLEPDMEDFYKTAHEQGFKHHIPGETELNLGRVLYMAKHKMCDAFLHLNPVFCCPGVVSASLFRKLQDELDIPIIDLYYDGTNKPNKIIVPHLYYLKKKIMEEQGK